MRSGQNDRGSSGGSGVGSLTREIPAMISLTGTADRRRPPCVHLRGLRWLRMVLAWQAVLQVYRAVLDRDDVTPGMIVCIQSFGELAHWHPHIHASVRDGQDSPRFSLYASPLAVFSGSPEKRLLSASLFCPWTSESWHFAFLIPTQRGQGKFFRNVEPHFVPLGNLLD